MAVDAARYSARSRRGVDPAARERKEKIVLVVGVLVLVLLGAWQGPKTLKQLHGSSVPTTPAAPAPPSVSGGSGSQATAAAPARVDLRAVRAFAVKDPFQPQLGTTAAPSSVSTAVAPPAVRTSHFVAKDPFVPQLSVTGGNTSSTTSAAPSKGTSKGSSKQPAAATGAAQYIVMVASVPLDEGRKAADAAAAHARGSGVTGVHVVDSSGYPTLRSGYYAVYAGPYRSLGAALQAEQSVRGKGYVSAYTRQLGH